MVRLERHKCKLCSRSFSSGRALGGHMRSHLANLPLPPKTQQKQETSSSQHPQLGAADDSTVSTTSSDCSLSEEEVADEEKGLVYGLRENPKKSFRLVDPQFLDGGSVVVVQDRENEAESTRKPTRRRSKRTRRMLVTAAKHEDDDVLSIKKEKMMKPISTTEPLLELEPAMSSVSDTSPEENLALCLIMLSRDVWRRTGTTSDDSADELKLISSSKRSHKKKKIKINIDSSSDQENEEGESSEELELPRNVVRSNSIKNVTVDKKVHECPFCGKVYGSGQALGGHKRSHLLGSSTTATTKTTAADSF